MSKQNLVKGWMEAFGQATPDSPSMPSQQVQYLRWKLIMEEGKELADANDLVGALDAVSDLLYVVYGAAVAFGFSWEQVDRAFAEVHRSNMSKLWTQEEIDTHCMDGHVADRAQNPDGDRIWLVRRDDGKVIKSPSYSPANLAPILAA